MENEDVRAIVCELCGSNELIKDEGVFVCQHCGTKYTTEEARKLLVEASVTIDEPVRVQGVATVDNPLRRADDFERQKGVAPIVNRPPPESFGRFSDIPPWCHNHVMRM